MSLNKVPVGTYAVSVHYHTSHLLIIFLKLESKHPGFFSKFLMRGAQNFRSPSVIDRDKVGWGGGLAKKNPTEAITAHLMQN